MLVVGAGGLGINGVQIARAAGCAVAVVDPVASHRELALERGAQLAVAPDGAAEIRAWSDVGVDVALETSGARAGFDTAAAALRPGGRVVCCGYYPGTSGLDSARLVLKEIDVMGSVSASLPLARDALRAVEAEQVKPADHGDRPARCRQRGARHATARRRPGPESWSRRLDAAVGTGYCSRAPHGEVSR